MQPIRIAVGQMPRLLREIIVSSLSPHSDLEIVDVKLAATASPPDDDAIDVLMLGSEGAELSAEHERLLRSRPWLRILAIDGGGRHAAIYELRTHRIDLTEISTSGLAAAIREACAKPGAADLAGAGPGS